MTTECPLARWAESNPHGIALWRRRDSVTFRQFDRLVAQTVESLARFDVTPGSRVVFTAQRCREDIAMFWALWRLRAVACPISPLAPPPQQQAAADQVQATHILDREAVRTGLGTAENPLPEWDIRELEPDMPATILCSSGTTYHPKAVVHSLAAHFASAAGAAPNHDLHPGDRWLLSLPIHHVGGFAILVRTMLAGAALALPEPGVPLAESVHDSQATHVSIVCAQLQRLLDARTDFPTLKLALLGGGPCAIRWLQAARARGLPLQTTYGLTEMASQVTATGRPPCDMEALTTAGPLLPGRELCIDHGEILVRGATLCLGYFDANAIVPVVDSNGWFHTRDAGSLDQRGYLTVTGRLDEMFISGGENIHPEAIETALLSLAGVRQAAVVPVDDPRFGQRPVAFVEGEPFRPASWDQALRATLPPFMVPDHWLPWPEVQSAVGKPSRRKLQSLANHWVQQQAEHHPRPDPTAGSADSPGS